MKKQILFLLSMCFALFSYSQKCKFKVDKIDDFSKKRFILCNSERVIVQKSITDIPSYGGLGVSRFLLMEKSKFICALNLEYSDSSIYLRFNFSEKDKNLASYIKKIYIILDDSAKSVYWFEQPNNTYHESNGKIDESILSYKLNDKCISMLKINKIVKMRLQCDGMKQYDFEIKDKARDCLIDQFNCLSSLNLGTRPF